MTDHAELVHYEIAGGTGGIATITLDSPHNRNALSAQLIAEIFERLERAENDDAVRVVVLAATGSVFCSGADLSEASGAFGDFEEGPRTIVRLQRTIVSHSKPVVCRLQGAVRAGGIGLVAACDIAIAADAASFALTEVKLGLAPAAISLTVLPRMTSRAAAYTCLTGEKFTAAQAVEMGLVTTAVTDTGDGLDAALDREVARVAAELATGAPQGLRETKRLINASLLANIDAYGDDVAALSARLFGSDAAREAMLAFLAK